MSENKYQFEKLTPTDGAELKVYEEAIDYVFKNSDIKNVAISGAYSAGKSSLLASYKKKHNNIKFIHISLAHFMSPEKTEQENEHDVKESVLEGKILNQLLHQISDDKIPQTRFRVKKSIGAKSIVIDTIGFTIFIVAIILFSCFDIWKNYVESFPDSLFKTILSLSTTPYALFLDGFLILLLFSFILYDIISTQKNKNIFRKLNIQGNEFEIFEESDDSYFDKYLNEVLYLFENADADVIVFEDMDRFNANRIFERLREVNTLVNIQLINKKKTKVLRFFYLLRDDIFVSKDRTKFFDYIIPVVPVVDSSNSYNQFIAHLKRGGIFEKFDENFLQGLSLYIDDMRLLKNIYNEFLIYYNRLNIIELDCNKMLAIIAYKNLFPRDFAELQLNRGFVYTIFDNKNKLIETDIKNLSDKILEKNSNVKKAKAEHLKSIHELDVVFDDKRRTRSGYSRSLTREEEDEYANRKQNIENRINGNISKIEDEIKKLENERILIKNKQLFQLITRDNIDSIFSVTSTNEIGKKNDFNEIKCNEYFDLLKYLIRNGYIDETYADYMTYFYENSLSRIDKMFLRSITDKKAKDYSYQLKNPQLVISYLKAADFAQEEILNFDLLTYLLQTLSPFEYLERFIDQLKNARNFSFIGAYFDITTELKSFIKQFNIRWPQIFVTALKEQLLTEIQLKLYAIDTLYFSDDDIIMLMNENNCLCEYISNSRDFLSISNPDNERLIHCFTILKVSFKSFNYEVLDKTLFYRVYEESLYEINSENLKLIIREVLNVKNEEDILHKNYTILCNDQDSAITKYVNENIDEYFEVNLEMCAGNINDNEDVVISVLNNANISVNLKKKYILALNTVINHINEILNNSLWPFLLDAEIVRYSENNLMDCFLARNLEESVISYINRMNIDLDFSKKEYDDEEKHKLFEAVINCMAINNDKYKQILVSLMLSKDIFSYLDIKPEKMDILINEKIVNMTSSNLIFIRENYPEQKFDFIRKNIERYVEIMNDDLFIQDELLEVLSWDICDELKITLLNFSDNSISIIDKPYSSRVCLHILDNNLKVNDLPKLFFNYESWGTDVQNKIIELAAQHIIQIIDEPQDASEKLKYDLLRSRTVERSDKIDLFISMMQNKNENYIKEILNLLDLSEYLKIFETRYRPKFEINDENERLLLAFKQKGLIANYEESEKDGYYKIVHSKAK